MKSGGDKKYDHAKIEKKWQAVWEKKKSFQAGSTEPAKKFYSLIEFPYPSGDGLHVGHIRSNTAMDIISRKRRREGYNVLYPIGWDAFGLPTENYAIKTGIQPAVVTEKNTDTFRRQLKSLGFSFDWSREINTTDPKYYKWTQWIFLQFLKAGLAYKKKMAVNWCPKDLIVLANEEVVDGCCERCGTPVEKREKEQWMLAITKYADKLLEGLDATDYVMPILVDKTNPHQSGKPIVRRNVAHAIVFDPQAKKYLIIRNKKFGWDTVVIGGIETDANGVFETPETTARREVREETGYTDLEFKRILGGPTEAHYYTKHKGENRIAIAQAAYFELKSPARVEIGKDEDKENEILWIDEADFVPGKMVNSELGIWLERIKDPSKGWPKPLLDWPESIKQSQRNWIGKSEGAEIDFTLDFKKNPKDNERRGPDAKPAHLTVFTTRPDTLFGVTYIVLSPEHLWVKLATDENHDVLENKAEVKAYLQSVRKKSDIERAALGKEKTGVELKGVKAIHPATGKEIPMFIADYVLADYGTGAIMAVPAHDERDLEFAKKYNLPIKDVVDSSNDKLIDSGEFSGLSSEQAKIKITEKFGRSVTSYKLRDWVFSRQRYWGEPIPVIHCEKCGVVPVPDKDLPVTLPKVENYKPTETGESPLAAISKWVNVKCPNCKGKAKRETDTMPNWAGSSWYYLRYADPENARQFASPESLKYWTPVDWYNGGMEHTTLHLLYSRFWHKFLFDQGLVPTSEPYRKRTSHGLILAKGGEKMSKSKGNVVNPDGIVAAVGADSLRLYEMFMGPFEQAIAWDENGIVGCRRFIEKVWKLAEKIEKVEQNKNSTENISKTDTLIHKTIKKVSEDIEAMHFNTAVSALMIAVNDLEKISVVSREHYGTIIQLLAPFAPHVTEELWHDLGYASGKTSKKSPKSASIHAEPWPTYDPAKIADKNIRIAVQINGKTRAVFEADSADTEAMIREKALTLDEIKSKVYSKDIKKVIYVKGRLLNIVID